MIKLAIPKNEIYAPLFENCEHYCSSNNIKYYKLSENECSDYLLRNLVDAAFLTPLGYGKGVKIADFRIIPGPVLFTEDYTGLATIYFKKGLSDVGSILSNSPDDFMMIIARLLLNEKFGINLELERTQSSRSEILLEHDSAILWGSDKDDEVTLDISEEWYDLFEEPLPLGFWVCRAESYPPQIKEIVAKIASETLPEKQEIEEVQENTRHYQRKGSLYWRWMPMLETSVETVLLFLYLHQILSEIPAVKVLDRD